MFVLWAWLLAVPALCGLRRLDAMLLIGCQLRARERNLALSGQEFSLFGILFTGGFKALVEEHVSGHPARPPPTSHPPRSRKPPLKTALGMEAEREAKGRGAGGQGAKAGTGGEGRHSQDARDGLELLYLTMALCDL